MILPLLGEMHLFGRWYCTLWINKSSSKGFIFHWSIIFCKYNISMLFWCDFQLCQSFLTLAASINNTTNFSISRICIPLIGCWDRVTLTSFLAINEDGCYDNKRVCFSISWLSISVPNMILACKQNYKLCTFLRNGVWYVYRGKNI